MATAPSIVQPITAPIDFQSAITALQDSVSKEDVRAFKITKYEDVWATARQIERDLERRRSLRNFRRLQPFLAGLDQYSEAIAVFCNGTPVLPYIWGPIKLLLEIAKGHLSALERLIEAYGMIGEVMPRFDKLSSAFKEDPEFQRVMGYFFADILEFHRRAYKFFRQRGWTSLFESFWKNFNSRFQGILESLRRHRDLIDREAEVLNITEAKAWRTVQTEQLRQWRFENTQQLEKDEKIRLAADIRETFAWLNPPDGQENRLTKLSRACQSKDNHWILKNRHVESWLKDSREDSTVWLSGKPGAGKSVVCSIIIDYICETEKKVAIYYFCQSHQMGPHGNEVLRSLSSQLLSKNPALAPYILATFANNGQKPSAKSLRAILERLLLSLPYVRIIIDGIDECSLPDQDGILDDLHELEQIIPRSCKILFSARKTSLIMKRFHSKPTIRLEDHAEDMKDTITTLVESRLGRLRRDFEPETVEDLRRKIVDRANGMILWARLVMSILEESYAEQDFNAALETMPDKIERLYERIFARICGNAKLQNQKRAIRILQWMIAARRPLRRSELEYGITLDECVPFVTQSTRLRGDVLSLCAPILDVEDGPEGLVSFTHFTVYEYLQAVATSDVFQSPRAHLVVSLSCTLYLSRGLNLLNPSIATTEKRFEVLQLLHELHPYASHYLIEHILALSNDVERSTLKENDFAPLKHSLEQLAHVYHALLSMIEPGALPHTEQFSRHLDDFVGLLDLSAPCRELLTYELTHKLRALANNTERQSEGRVDPNYEVASLFSKARLIYHDIVEGLLSEQDASNQLLSDFKARYSFGVYTCRYPNCLRAIQGFMSPQLRQTHEDIHSPRYRCMEPQCKIPGSPFNTRAALTRHNKKYHAATNLSIIPSSLGVLTRNFRPDDPQEQKLPSQEQNTTQRQNRIKASPRPGGKRLSKKNSRAVANNPAAIDVEHRARRTTPPITYMKANGKRYTSDPHNPNPSLRHVPTSLAAPPNIAHSQSESLFRALGGTGNSNVPE